MHKGIKGMKINQCLERIYILRLKFYNIENNHFGFFLKHEKAGRKHNSRNQWNAGSKRRATEGNKEG